MNNALSPSLLARLTRTWRRAARDPEPADLGTAFGMEQWLDEADTEAPATQATTRRRTGSYWLPRWLQGGSTR